MIPRRAFVMMRWIALGVAFSTTTAVAAPVGVTISQLSGNLGAPYLLESHLTYDTLRINASARIQRAQNALPAILTVRWRATLSITGGAQIAQTSFSSAYSVSGFYDEIVNVAFELDPPFLLADDTSHTLLLEVFHIEDPAVGAFTLDDDQPLTYLNFPHFSGALNFGSIRTSLTDLESNGSPVSPQYLGGHRWQFTFFGGELTGGLPYANTSNSSPTLTAFRDPATGDLTVTAGNAEIDDGDGSFSWGAWQASRGIVLIAPSGIAARKFRLVLPPGLGWRDGTSGILRSVFDSESVALPLTPTLQPPSSVNGVFPAGREFIDDCLAVSFTPPRWTFDGTVLALEQPGTRFLRRSRYQQELTETGKLPRTNDCYLFRLQSTAGSDLEVLPGDDGGISIALNLAPGDYTAHFPDADVGGLASTLRIANSRVDPDASTAAADWIHLQYDKGCPDLGLGAKQGMRILSPELSFTAQAGLVASGNLATDAQFNGVERHLVIGLNEDGEAVHATDPFTESSFYMPGPCVPPDPTDSNFNPARFLHAEIQTDHDGALGYPGTTDYEQGFGHYAGFNFLHFAGLSAASRVAGSNPVSYLLLDNTKAYARCSGASGIIEADPAALPFMTTLYGSPIGFPISFTHWGFNALSNRMLDSYIDGQIDLSATYAGFVQGAEEMRISCCGNLSDFKLPPGEEAKRLDYWQDFEIRNASAAFVTPGDCDDSRACLRYASVATVNGLPGDKAGYLCFLGDGSMTVPSDPDFAPSQLSLVAQSGFAGQYYFWPTSDLFFNNPNTLPAGDGFVTGTGALDVAFFDNIAIRFHTFALPEIDDEVLVGFVQGDYLEGAEVDLSHRGTPPGMTPGQYRDSATFHPRAMASFFGKEGAFDFPVTYNTPTGNFHTPGDTEADLILLTVDSGIDRVNAKLAQIHFGLDISGLLQMSVGKLIEEATAYGAQGVAQELGEEIAAPIKEGLLALAETLDNRLETLLQATVERATETSIVGPLAQALRTMEQNNPAWAATDLNATLDTKLGANGPLEQALEGLGTFQDATETATTAIGTLRDRLEKLENALDCVVQLLDGDASGHAGLSALLNYALAEFALNPMGGELPPDIADTGLQSLIAEADTGWLGDAREALAKLRDIVAETNDLLAQGQDFLNEVSDAVSDMQAVVAGVRNQVFVRVSTEMNGQVREFSDEEIREVIRGAIRDHLFASLEAVNIQSILRARLGYLDTVIQEALATAMQAFSRAIVDILDESGALGAINSALEGVTDTFSGVLSYVKSIRLQGEATTRSDRLTQICLQTQAEFSIPTPIGIGIPMSADALLKYNERVSDGSSVCEGPVGDVTPEIYLKSSGGTNVGFGLDSRMDLELKFSFVDPGNFTPTGFAGYVQVMQDGLDVNSMGMQQFSATMALGGNGDGGTAREFYLAAHCNGRFGAGPASADLEGGFFLGQTCSAAPFAFYPDFNFAPGPGGYARGVAAHLSGKVPLLGGGCLFNVTAGAEVGAIALSDSGNLPVFGGVLGGSISGELLCLLKAEGSLSLGYLYEAGINTHTFDGSAEAKACIGFKPFQICKSKSIDLRYIKVGGGSGNWLVNP